MPRHEDINWTGLEYDKQTFLDIMSIGKDAGTAEAHAHEVLFDRFFDRLPKEFIYERQLLRGRLWRSPDQWELAAEGD
jgi:phosphoenolpyruvate carboxykinase (GTP)